MGELIGNNKRLTINLASFLSSSDNQNSNNNWGSSRSSKSPKNFEEPIGLGIVAAMNESDQSNDQNLNSSAKCNRGPILSVSLRSNPIPILSPNSGSAESEEYTCVISHIGNNLIKKREYFDGDLVSGSEKTTLISGLGRLSGDSPETELEELEPAEPDFHQCQDGLQKKQCQASHS